MGTFDLGDPSGAAGDDSDHPTTGSSPSASLAPLAPATYVPYSGGDVFVAGSAYGGSVNQYGSDGSLLDSLSTGAQYQETGMCFDWGGDLFATNFSDMTVAKFDSSGHLLNGAYLSLYNGLTTDRPESCAIDSNGDIYVGSVDYTGPELKKYDPNGNLIASYSPAVDNRGVDWIALAGDDCTLFYTSEAPDVKRFNVCTGTQEADFVDNLPKGACFQLAIRPNGEVMATCQIGVVRLSPSGSIIQTYPMSNYGEQNLFAFALDPDNSSFWLGDYNTSDVLKIDIASGAELLKFNNPQGVSGLAVFGANGPVGGPISPSETLGSGNPSEAPTECNHGGYPVGCGTGNFWHSFTDLSIPGRGLALDLTRTYNSLAAGEDGPFGFGWSSSYTMSLTTDQSGAVTVHQEDGATTTFTPGANGYKAPPRVIATLVQNGDGSYTFTRRRRETFVFSANGSLLSETDLNGYTTSLSYNGSGQLTTVTDPAGRSLTFSYGPNGKVASVTDPGGRLVSYGYDDAGDLTSVTDAGNGITQFGYDSNHLLTSMTDPNNGTLTNVYDAKGRVTSQTDPMQRTTTYDYHRWGTTITSPSGNVTTEQYVNGELIQLTKGAGTSDAASWSYSYDPKTASIISVTDPDHHMTLYSYDADGNVVQIVDPLRRTTNTTYNNLDEPLTVEDPSGVTTTRTYDSAGNLLTVSRRLGNTLEYQTTKYYYDDSAHPGDVTKVFNPDNKQTTYSYDAYGDVAKVVDPLGDTVTYTYNNLGEKTSMVSARGNAPGANPADFTTSYEYDAFGDLTKTTDPLGDITAATYDGNRNRTSVTDPDNKKTTYTYNADNEITQVTRADNSTIGYGYDGDGNQTSQTNAANHTTSYGYDALDRLTSVTDPLNRKTTYGYDRAGNRTMVTNPAGQTTTFGYDADNELTSISYSDGGKTAPVSFSYTANGLRQTMVDGSGETDYSYDTLNRLTSVTNGAGQTVGYGYDLANHLTSISYPNGKTVTRGYDDVGRLTSVTDWLNNTSQFSHDEDGDLTGITYPNGTSDSRTYDNADQLSTITDSKGATTLASFNYARDNNGQLTSTATTGLGQPNETYGYNPLNQLTAVNSTSYNYDAADNPTTLGSATLGYDNANEVTSYQNGSTNATFSYNSQGDRLNGLTATGAAATYLYDQADRLVQVKTGTGALAASGLLAAGASHSLAITKDGKVWAWGGNSYGQLGNGTTTTSKTPVQVSNLSGAVAVAAGDNHSLAITNDGKVWAWGYNNYGQLGNGTTTNATTPVTVSSLSGVLSVAGGSRHSLAVNGDGTVAAWGYNNYGQLGNGTTTTSHTPVTVSNLTNAATVAAGSSHSLALLNDGSVWAWGYNKSGQLGNGTTTNSSTPVQVSNLSGVVAIAAGGSDSYALRSDGTVWAWGDNSSDQLGNGSSSRYSTTPVQITLNSKAVFIAAGGSHALAILSDGTVWAWGYNRYGQLGNGTTTSSSTPVQVKNLTGAVSLAGGANHSLASTTAALAYGWGYNSSGQLGNGTTTNSSTPVQTSTLTTVIPGAQPGFNYNGDGLRTSKTSAGITLNYAWDTSGQIPLLLTDGTLDYIYGPGNQPLEQITDSSGSTLYFHTDQLGSTRLLTDSSGAIAATYTYDAYGNTAQHTGTATTNLQYAGQYLDSEAGLYYLRARYYDPQTAQFVTRDVLAPLTQAPYGYALDNPLNTLDPLGLWGWNPISDLGEGLTDAGRFFSNHAAAISTVAGLASIALPPGFDLVAAAVAAAAGAVASAHDLADQNFTQAALDAASALLGGGGIAEHLSADILGRIAVLAAERGIPAGELAAAAHSASDLQSLLDDLGLATDAVGYASEWLPNLLCQAS